MALYQLHSLLKIQKNCFLVPLPFHFPTKLRHSHGKGAFVHGKGASQVPFPPMRCSRPVDFIAFDCYQLL